MIALLEGTVVEKSEGEVVLLAGGIGFRLLCSMTTLAALPAAGGTCRLYTHFNVREDAMELFGFVQREERDMFRHLIAVSGIGPKSALFVLGSMPLADLRLAILTGDLAALSRAPGIGKKTAQRIALELKEKVSEGELLSASPSGPSLSAQDLHEDCVTEAMAALQALGYTASEAAGAVAKVKDQTNQASELVRLALKNMAGM